MRIGNRKKMKTETEETYQARMREYDRKELKDSITTEVFSGIDALGWVSFLCGIAVRVGSEVSPYDRMLSTLAAIGMVRLIALIMIIAGFSFIALGQLVCIRQILQKQYDVQKYIDIYGKSPYEEEGKDK